MKKMLANNRTLILLLGFLVFLIFACVGNKSPVSSNNHTYEIAYGTISQVDDYPLYMYTYSADYKFDDYLETGTIPFYASTETNIKNYAALVFQHLAGIIDCWAEIMTGQTTLAVLPYYPFDGMNEKGVAVGMNALANSHGPGL